MKVISEAALDRFRTSGPCECCQKFCQRREPHHILSRGQEGQRRIDKEENLVALGGTFDCLCHRNATLNRDGFLREDMAELAGRRLGKTGAECIKEVERIRSLHPSEVG